LRKATTLGGENCQIKLAKNKIQQPKGQLSWITTVTNRAHSVNLTHH
jgi:hypothetical protein